MKDKLVTLIGGGGFLGRYAAQELLARGARIRIVQRRPRDAWFLKPLGGLGQVQFVAGDVTMPDTIANAVEGSDAVVNLAGTYQPDRFQALHVKGAATVALAAHRAGATAFVHVSAIGADSDSPLDFAKSKAAGERAVHEAFANATILRPATLFGREDQFVNRLAARIANQSLVPVARGAAKLQPAWVADAGAAIAVALADPLAHGGHCYELGGPDTLSLTELLRWIAREIDRQPTLIEIPDAISGLMLGGTAPLSRDQWRTLKPDNLVAPDARGFTALGIQPTPLAAIAPAWLVQIANMAGSGGWARRELLRVRRECDVTRGRISA